MPPVKMIEFVVQYGVPQGMLVMADKRGHMAFVAESNVDGFKSLGYFIVAKGEE